MSHLDPIFISLNQFFSLHFLAHWHKIRGQAKWANAPKFTEPGKVYFPYMYLPPIIKLFSEDFLFLKCSLAFLKESLITGKFHTLGGTNFYNWRQQPSLHPFLSLSKQILK